MPDNYQVLGGVGTVELLGGGQTQEVIQGTARAQPSGVLFTLVIAKVDWTPSRLELIFGPVSDAINKANDVAGVADISLYQDVNNQGQFVNRLDVVVTSSSGRSETTIHPPYGSLFDDRFAAAVGAARDNLDAVEAS